MLTKKQAYLRKLNEIVARYGHLEDSTVQDVAQLLAQLQAEIANELLKSNGTNAVRLRQLLKQLETMTSGVEGQFMRQMDTAVRGVYLLGGESVTAPLVAAGVGGVLLRPLSPAQLNTLLGFSADLVRGLSADMLQKINAQIRLVALGGKSSFEAMKEIATILGTGGKEVVGGVSARAERIIRTELGRVQNISAHSQQLALAEQMPDIRKRWIATGDGRTRQSHLQVHTDTRENPLPVDQPYNVGGHSMMYPLDPAGPASETVLCRCREITVHSDIGNITLPLDSRIDGELERRQDE